LQAGERPRQEAAPLPASTTHRDWGHDL